MRNGLRLKTKLDQLEWKQIKDYLVSFLQGVAKTLLGLAEGLIKGFLLILFISAVMASPILLVMLLLELFSQ